MRRRTFLVSLAGFASPALAHSTRVGDIKIGHAWALPASLGVDGQAFVPLLSVGTEPDALVAARSSRAAYIEMRRNNRYVDEAVPFDLLPNKPISMRPTDRHLRLVGLTQPLVLGERFPIILDFLNAGEIEVEFYVETTPGQ